MDDFEARLRAEIAKYDDATVAAIADVLRDTQSALLALVDALARLVAGWMGSE